MHGREYVSGARVVLLGHGADEVFGGYGRYRTRFREEGWGGLAGEMGKDMQRLWRRNLGRDDRVTADISRESRHPFLDENLLQVRLTSCLYFFYVVLFVMVLLCHLNDWGVDDNVPMLFPNFCLASSSQLCKREHCP